MPCQVSRLSAPLNPADQPLHKLPSVLHLYFSGDLWSLESTVKDMQGNATYLSKRQCVSLAWTSPFTLPFTFFSLGDVPCEHTVSVSFLVSLSWIDSLQTFMSWKKEHTAQRSWMHILSFNCCESEIMASHNKSEPIIALAVACISLYLLAWAHQTRPLKHCSSIVGKHCKRSRYELPTQSFQLYPTVPEHIAI